MNTCHSPLESSALMKILQISVKWNQHGRQQQDFLRAQVQCEREVKCRRCSHLPLLLTYLVTNRTQPPLHAGESHCSNVTHLYALFQVALHNRFPKQLWTTVLDTQLETSTVQEHFTCFAADNNQTKGCLSFLKKRLALSGSFTSSKCFS